MKIRTQTTALLAALLVGTLFFWTACAKPSGTEGIERQEKTTSSMQEVESNIQQVSAKIDETNSSLNNLVSTPSNLVQSFKSYSDNVNEMEETGNQLLSRMNDMSRQGNEYFEEWRKEGQEYTSPEIRKLSEERRLELRRAFTDVADASVGVKGSLDQYLSEVKEIQSYLSNNLSPDSVNAITPVAERTIADGRNLKQQLTPVQTAIDKTQSMMSTSGIAAGGTGAGQDQQD